MSGKPGIAFLSLLVLIAVLVASCGAPLTIPVAVSACIIAFIFSWNNFLFSLVLAGPDTQPLPVAAFKFLSYGNVVQCRIAKRLLIRKTRC
jgi:ABC-type spermidine/putrescine transport system permease subunit II